MWLKRETYERLVSKAALSCHIPKLEQRAEAAEAALAKERSENSADLRHFASMWLRKNGSYPLPKTADEKAEAKAERAERANQPPVLSADQLARRDAVRLWAKNNGYTEEEADKKFMAQLHEQVDIE